MREHAAAPGSAPEDPREWRPTEVAGRGDAAAPTDSAAYHLHVVPERSAVPRRVSVAPERLTLWLQRYAEQHGPLRWNLTPDAALARAHDGTEICCSIPFPPLPLASALAEAAIPEALIAHALAERTVGVLLVRLGGFAAGVFSGSAVVVSKCGSRPVHGRNAAGGSSQQRFARRRENQATAALAAATEAAARVLLPLREQLDGLVLGGDRRALTLVLNAPQLAPLRGLVTGPLLEVRTPRRAVLLEASAAARLVHLRIAPLPERDALIAAPDLP